MVVHLKFVSSGLEIRVTQGVHPTVPIVLEFNESAKEEKRCNHAMHSEGVMAYEPFLTRHVIHGHRTLKAPHPVRSAQLTRVPPS